MNFHFDKMKWNKIIDLIASMNWTDIFKDDNTYAKKSISEERKAK